MPRTFPLIILITLLISCSREMSVEPAPGRISGDSGIIVKRVDEFTEPPSAAKAIETTNYEYNSGKKLIRTIYVAIRGSDSTYSESIYGRDNDGRIVAIEYKSRRFVNGIPYVTPEGSGSDTSSSVVIYEDALSGKINYIKTIDHSGVKASTDSVSYEYDSNDHVMKTTLYSLPSIQQPGDTLILSGYSSWIFDEKGNLVQSEDAGTDTSGLIRYRYEYDNKINPLYTHDDVFLSQWTDFSKNNLVKQNVYIPVTGQDYNNTAVYQYRFDNKPSSANYYSPVVNGTHTTSYYYK